MSVLINALKREHETLKNQVATIKEAGVMSAEGVFPLTGAAVCYAILAFGL